MDLAESVYEQVEENPSEEEEATAALVDEPLVPPVHPAGRLVGKRALSDGGCRALETLQAAALGLVTLEMAGLLSRSVVGHVGMHRERDGSRVGKVVSVCA